MMKMDLKKWIALAFGIRVISSWTHSSWHHPDEWYQTVEFGNWMINGFLANTQEVGLHLRNLTWPWMLSLPLALSKAIDPAWIGLRVFLVQLLTGLLDLLTLWGIWSLLRPMRLNLKLQNAILATFILPYFLVSESIRPSQEHLAGIALWVCLGLLVREKWFWAGIAMVAIGAFKYPAGLLSVGIFLAIMLQSLKERQGQKAGLVSLGAIAGLGVFGIADWVYYGRPWESLWMYLQYNVFTGMSARNFGSQSAREYIQYWFGHWRLFLLPMGIVALPLALLGSYRGLVQLKPWAWALVIYLIGHLLISHKEPRFMAPVEFLIIWAAWMGALPYIRLEKIPRAIKLALAAIVAANLLFLLRGLWGENWVANGTYFEMGRHLKASDQICGIISVRKPLSVLLPWKDARNVPEPAFAFFPSEKRKPSFSQTRERPLIWIEKPAFCTEKQEVLVHVHKPDLGWDSQGCEIQASGIFRFIPQALWGGAMDKDLASGTWYLCPSAVLSSFPIQETRMILAHGIGHIAKLPHLGISGEELVKLGQRSYDSSRLADGTLGDW